MPLAQVIHDLVPLLVLIFGIDADGIDLVFLEAGFAGMGLHAFTDVHSLSHVDNVMLPLRVLFRPVAVGEDIDHGHTPKLCVVGQHHETVFLSGCPDEFDWTWFFCHILTPIL